MGGEEVSVRLPTLLRFLSSLSHSYTNATNVSVPMLLVMSCARNSLYYDGREKSSIIPRGGQGYIRRSLPNCLGPGAPGPIPGTMPSLPPCPYITRPEIFPKTAVQRVPLTKIPQTNWASHLASKSPKALNHSRTRISFFLLYFKLHFPSHSFIAHSSTSKITVFDFFTYFFFLFFFSLRFFRSFFVSFSFLALGPFSLDTSSCSNSRLPLFSSFFALRPDERKKVEEFTETWRKSTLLVVLVSRNLRGRVVEKK